MKIKKAIAVFLVLAILFTFGSCSANGRQAASLDAVDGREYYFNGYNTIYSKTAYTYDNDLAGVMILNGQCDLPREANTAFLKPLTKLLKAEHNNS